MCSLSSRNRRAPRMNEHFWTSLYITGHHCPLHVPILFLCVLGSHVDLDSIRRRFTRMRVAAGACRVGESISRNTPWMISGTTHLGRGGRGAGRTAHLRPRASLTLASL